ncbi:MAG: bifunctional methylenetetrahydrofolate dehydrogenase/methenyltetrahydrofolate cyclohydrolase FolD [Rhabdochlamydiaceae bacterium]|nr:bifunctional methylenetetrahydrofolate dehydrogenase/methenyltetrahydrofolate cyclohydrolase FolD [Rhabdochlamydiaceae bacterium]
MKIIDGKHIAQTIEKEIAQEVAALSGRKPGLAFVRVGDDPASKVYIQIKKKKCAEVGILSWDEELPSSASKEQVLDILNKLNENPLIDGILVQLPLPSHLSAFALMEHILPSKDVDGFHPLNMGKLLLGERGGHIPCTPQGVHKLLTHSSIEVAGKHVVILGRSNIVGKPLAALLMQKFPSCNATVTLVHSRSCNIPKLCQEADILIAAIGQPRFVTKEMVRPGTVVIDVGINKIGSSLVGDVDFDHVSPICSHITPVPGGVGPMTVACLLSNTLQAYKNKQL